MRFKIDENMPVEAASILNDSGYDAMTNKWLVRQILKLLPFAN